MLELLFVALFQAAAGDVTETATAPTAEPATESQSSDGGIDARDTVQCRRVRQLGSRARSELVCTSLRQEEEEREETRRMHERVTQPTPTAPSSGMGPG